MNSALDRKFEDASLWREEAIALRKILLDCDLTETLKWGKPCYTNNGKNICIIQRMNDFLALLFFKGALLKDPDRVLQVQGPNSRAGYRICFTDIREVERLGKIIKAYVVEAIRVERAGLRIDRRTAPDPPEELTETLSRDAELKSAFESLTPGRKRGYIYFISSARQAKTRLSRIARSRSRILQGKGIHDK